MKRRGETAVTPSTARRHKRRKGAELAHDNEEHTSASEGEGGDLAGISTSDRRPSGAAAHANVRGHKASARPTHGAAEGGPDADADDDTDASDKADTPDIDAAAKELTRLTGISAASAAQALKETEDKVFSEQQQGGGSGGGALLQSWLEEAQIWLACNMEVQVEIDEVRAAMQESLQQYEAAKAADDMPLGERPPDYLRDRFITSACSSATRIAPPRSSVVMRLAEFACHRALFANGTDHKAPLVRLAELESKCRKWYPTKGTNRFWEQLADECSTAVVTAAPALKQEQWLGCTDGPAGCSTCAAALGTAQAPANGGPSTSAPAAQPDAAASTARVQLDAGAATVAASALGTFAKSKSAEVEVAVCKMPTIAGEVPDIFSALDDGPGDEGGSDAEDIVCLVAGSSDPSGGQDQVAL